MEPGTHIEHYVIIEKIGQGGQAAVWSAIDERLKRTVAIKTINLTTHGASGTETGPTGKSNLTTPDQFREEAEIIAALEHPNILPVYAFGQTGRLAVYRHALYGGWLPARFAAARKADAPAGAGLDRGRLAVRWIWPTKTTSFTAISKARTCCLTPIITPIWRISACR